MQRPGAIYYGCYLAAFAFFLGFTSGAVYLHSRGVFVRDQLLDFDVSRAELSYAFTAAQAASLLFAPLLGVLLDRFPIRYVMAAGTVWLGLGFFVMAEVDGIVAFGLVTALFVGLATGAIGTTANSKLMVNWFDRRRGLALGIAITGYSVAGIVTAPVAVRLLDSIGWRGSYRLFGAFCLLVVLPLVWRLVKQRPADLARRWFAPGAAGRTTSSLAAFRAIAGSKPFWGVVLVFGLADGVFGALNLHLFLHYLEVGINDYRAALILSTTAGAAIVAKPLSGLLIDRFGPRSAALAAIGVCIVAMGVLIGARTYPVLLVAAGLAGLAFGGMVPLRAALLSRLFEPDAFGRAYGSFKLCIAPITLLWTPVMGHLHDATGSYVPAFQVFIAAFAIAIVTAYGLIRVPSVLRPERAGRRLYPSPP